MKTIKRLLADLISEKVSEIYMVDIQPLINIPRERENGDFSSPVAMALAKKVKKSPREISEKIKAAIIDSSSSIDKIVVAGPGFLNFFLSSEFLLDSINRINENIADYRSNDILKKERYLIEFVSANPVGPLNIVSSRAAALGDILAVLLLNCGAHVDKEYFVNDRGNQINLLGKSLYVRYL